MLDKKSGKMVKMHTLCPVSDGEDKARELKRILLGTNNEPACKGDFCSWMDKWRRLSLKRLSKEAPKDHPSTKNISNLKSILHVIEGGFCNFDLTQVKPTDVAEFLDFWEGQRIAQIYKSHMTNFFDWYISRTGLITVNPVASFELEPVEDREVYMSDDQFHSIRDTLLIGVNEKPTRTGEMVQCYMDLCYLFYQRTTEIRLLRWNQASQDGILFKPTKT